MRRSTILAVALALVPLSCSDGGSPMTPTSQVPATPQPTPALTPTPVATPTPPPSPTPNTFSDDEGLFQLISREEPYQSYQLFPGTDEISSGRLDGAGAHPRARVRLNTPAIQSLTNGKLPAGSRFRSGSVIVKEVLGNSPTILAVMRRTEGATSGAGWQWAEFRLDGSVIYSVNARGGACIACHSRQQGPQNDLVRTFERQ